MGKDILKEFINKNNKSKKIKSNPITPIDFLNSIIPDYSSSRDFARQINEDGADVARWRSGKIKIKARAIVSICRKHPHIKPWQLNESIFPKDLSFIFTEENKNE